MNSLNWLDKENPATVENAQMEFRKYQNGFLKISLSIN